MSTNEDQKFELIMALFDGELSGEEKASAETLLAEDPQLQLFAEELKSTQELLQSVPELKAPESVTDRISKEVNQIHSFRASALRGSSSGSGDSEVTGNWKDISQVIPLAHRPNDSRFSKLVKNPMAWAGFATAAGLLIAFSWPGLMTSNTPDELAFSSPSPEIAAGGSLGPDSDIVEVEDNALVTSVSDELLRKISEKNKELALEESENAVLADLSNGTPAGGGSSPIAKKSYDKSKSAVLEKSKLAREAKTNSIEAPAQSLEENLGFLAADQEVTDQSITRELSLPLQNSQEEILIVQVDMPLDSVRMRAFDDVLTGNDVQFEETVGNVNVRKPLFGQQAESRDAYYTELPNANFAGENVAKNAAPADPTSPAPPAVTKPIVDAIADKDAKDAEKLEYQQKVFGNNAGAGGGYTSFSVKNNIQEQSVYKLANEKLEGVYVEGSDREIKTLLQAIGKRKDMNASIRLRVEVLPDTALAMSSLEQMEDDNSRLRQLAGGPSAPQDQTFNKSRAGVVKESAKSVNEVLSKTGLPKAISKSGGLADDQQTVQQVANEPAQQFFNAEPGKVADLKQQQVQKPGESVSDYRGAPGVVPQQTGTEQFKYVDNKNVRPEYERAANQRYASRLQNRRKNVARRNLQATAQWVNVSMFQPLDQVTSQEVLSQLDQQQTQVLARNSKAAPFDQGQGQQEAQAEGKAAPEAEESQEDRNQDKPKDIAKQAGATPAAAPSAPPKPSVDPKPVAPTNSPERKNDEADGAGRKEEKRATEEEPKTEEVQKRLQQANPQFYLNGIQPNTLITQSGVAPGKVPRRVLFVFRVIEPSTAPARLDPEAAASQEASQKEAK